MPTRLQTLGPLFRTFFQVSLAISLPVNGERCCIVLKKNSPQEEKKHFPYYALLAFPFIVTAQTNLDLGSDFYEGIL